MKTITKIALAFLSGLLISAAWPTGGFAPLAFVAFIPLLYLQDRIGDKKKNEKGNVFLLSLITFITWNSLTTWWVWKTTAAGTIGMILLNSVFMALVFWAYHLVKTKLYDNRKGYYVLIILVLAFEYLHLNWQLNWPWLNLGNVFSHYYSWVQWYEWTGSAGGTAWVLASNILIYKALKFFIQNRYYFKTNNNEITDSNGKTIRQQLRIHVAKVILILLIPFIISKIIYKSYNEEGEDVEIVVVQPNLDPYSEEFTLTPSQIMNRNLDVAIPLITEKTRFLVSPESAIQEMIWLDKIDMSYSINRLRSVIDYYPQLCYVIGMGPFGFVPEGEEGDFAARKFIDVERYFYAYNTAALITKDSIQLYHKSRLTPGVEAMPSWWFIRPLAKMAIDLGGTSGTLKKDKEARVLSFDNHKVGTLICYESAFGGYVTEFVKKGADLLFVITNDGWWGDTPGHRQHLEFSSLRAIETRRSIARSANTGISAFINQKGDIVEQSKYWEQTALRNAIKTNNKQTFYVRYGDYIYKISVFLTALLLVLTFVKIITKRK